MISNKKLRDVERFISGTIKERTGKGPQLAKAVMKRENVLIEFSGLLTKMERSYIDSIGESAYKTVEETRLNMIGPMLEYYRKGIEDIVDLPVARLDVTWDARQDKCTALAVISQNSK